MRNIKATSKNTSENEFIFLVALITSLMALSTDALLPALVAVGVDLQVDNPNHVQWLITGVFAGFAVGGLFSGPLADAYGRLPIAYFGGAIFLVGCTISMFTDSFEILLLSRVLQGLGASGPRIAVQAMVRDRFVGDAMARVMSFVTSVFIAMPLIAPSIGQWIYQTSGWRTIFLVQALAAAAGLIWLGLRQTETLSPELKRSASPLQAMRTYLVITRIPQSMLYIIVSGLSGAPFIAYLSMSPQLLQQQYNFGDKFPLVFAALALPYGLASLLNGKLVLRFGTRYMVNCSLLFCSLVAITFVPVIIIYNGHPPLWTLLLFLVFTAIALGLLSGNLVALALEPLGQMAGSGAALQSSLSIGISMVLGVVIGSFYNNSPMPLAAGYFVLCSISLLLTRADRHNARAAELQT